MEPISTGAPIGEAELESGNQSSEAQLAAEFANFFVDSELIDIVLEDEEL